MSIRLQSAVAAAVAVMAWIVVRLTMVSTTRDDILESRRIGRLMDAGLIPYRDFDVHSTPLATGLSWAIALIPGSATAVDASLIAIALAVGAAATWAVARHLGLRTWRCLLATTLVAGAPLVVEAAATMREDVLLTALVACALLAALQGRFRWMWAMLTVAAAIGVAMIALFPVAAVWHGARRGRGQATTAVVVALGALALTVLAAIAASPAGAWHLARVHLAGPLDGERLGAAMIRAAHLPFRPLVGGEGSDMIGAVPTVVAVASTAAMLAAIIAIVVLTARVRPADHGMVGALAATALATQALGATFAPGHAMWLIPAASLIPGRLGSVCAVAVTVAVLMVRLVPVDLMELVSAQTTFILVLQAVAVALALVTAAAAIMTRQPSQGRKRPQTA